MSNELKPLPCPWCGRTPSIYHHAEDANFQKGDRDYWLVRCWGKEYWEDGEDCSVMPDGLDWETKDEAIAAWNHRDPEPMTNVVRWTRYTSEPVTLPEVNRWFIHSGIPMMAHTEQALVDNIPVGNLWAYLPELPEGAE